MDLTNISKSTPIEPYIECDGGYYARKFKVAIQVSEFPNNDGELGLSGVFLALGDPVVGTFNTKEKTFAEGFTAQG